MKPRNRSNVRIEPVVYRWVAFCSFLEHQSRSLWLSSVEKSTEISISLPAFICWLNYICVRSRGTQLLSFASSDFSTTRPNAKRINAQSKIQKLCIVHSTLCVDFYCSISSSCGGASRCFRMRSRISEHSVLRAANWASLWAWACFNWKNSSAICRPASIATFSESTVIVPDDISRILRSTYSASSWIYSLSPSDRMLYVWLYISTRIVCSDILASDSLGNVRIDHRHRIEHCLDL